MRRNMMTVGDLKKLLADVPDGAALLCPASDHEYQTASVDVTTALHDAEHCCWSEDHGEDVTPEADYGKRLPVVVVS